MLTGLYRATALAAVAAACCAAPLAAQQDTTRAPVAAPALPALPPVPPPIDTLPPQVAIRPVPPPVPAPWRFSVEIGFTDIAGNRDLQVFNGVYTAEHQRTTEYVLNLRAEARYGRTEDIVAVENGALRLRFDWRPRETVSPFLGLDVESDRIRKIDARIKGGAGMNVNIAPREDRRTTVAVGLIAEIEERFRHVDPRHRSDWRLHTRFATLQPLNSHVVFEGNARLQPAVADLSDYEATGDVSLRVTVTRTMAFRTRWEWRRDSTPAPGVSGEDDRSLTFALLMSW